MFAPVTLILALQGAPAEEVDRAVADGISRGVFPGAVVVIGTRDSILHARGYGRFTWSRSSAVPHPDSTIFDLASLTKIVATTASMMRLVEQGRVSLDDRVQDHLPEFVGDGKDGVTVRHLLEHRSGLRAFLELDKLTASAEEARARVMAEELRRAPGAHVEYSDLNAKLLGWIVEKVSGVPLDEFTRREITGPLGMDHTMFTPPRALRPRIAPVGLWRGHAISGEVHDQNAARLGGVAGHAGLYGTGRDLSRFAQTLLRNGEAPEGGLLFTPEIIATFVQRGPGNRALGWDMRDTTSDDHSAGVLLSSAAYGHTGFTGTSIWIDPVRDLFVIVLTNRVFNPRTPRSISELRRVRARVADAAVAMTGGACLVVAGVRSPPEAC